MMKNNTRAYEYITRAAFLMLKFLLKLKNNIGEFDRNTG